jgi:hypothetical protein
MFFPCFLGIMDKFIIMNVHDATPRTPINNPNFFHIFFLGVWKSNTWFLKIIIIFILYF